MEEVLLKIKKAKSAKAAVAKAAAAMLAIVAHKRKVGDRNSNSTTLEAAFAKTKRA
eukprot:CAMPEP_0180681458 /NCGR_PEP_ID=MMETSP1037_2-20121125/70009_1 /TAXON_ID=632150 /ORGANISM="Azadinium spinosum, Strain 3D9" /LENGTH=55 /DNA_ID=CAMNT_0022711335 /DNA_START=39 /DNA_END=207 /DNA_ORIENTATION=+